MNHNINIALYQPEIPPNTGNIIRLCANTNSHLHLIHPLGFTIDDKRAQRAGLDYHELTHIVHHADYAAFSTHFAGKRIFACSTKGTQKHTDVRYADHDVLLFGPETRGLPSEILDSLPHEQLIRIPMAPNNRSLNLSNAVAVVTYEVWRQWEFAF